VYLDFENLNLNTLRDNYAGNAYLSSVIDFVETYLEADSFISYTSGSTGDPKPLRIEKTKAVASAKLSNQFFKINAASNIVLCMDIKYIGSKMLLIRAHQAGSKVEVIYPSLNFYKDVLTTSIDFISLTPMHVNHILKNGSHFFSKVKTCLIGASGVSSELEASITKDLGNTVFYESFAMTETLSHFALRTISLQESYFQCLEGFEVSLNENDCLEVFHPIILPEKLGTNDIVRCIDKEKFTFIGRRDHVINTGGLKLSPENLEKEWSLFLPFKFILAGEYDAVLGQKLIMILETNGAMTKEQIRQLLKDNFIPVKYVPKEFYIANKWYETESLKPLRREIVKNKQIYFS